MRYRTGADLRRAIDLQHQKVGGDKQRLLHAIARERFLARVVACEPSVPIILKGGTAMEIRLGTKARTTLDIDFSAEDIDAAIDLINRAVTIDLGDHFEFTIAEQGQLQSGVFRATIAVTFGGRPFGPTRFIVDIGPSTGHPIEQHTLTSNLAFAGIGPLNIPMIAAEDHYAEKFHGATLPRAHSINMRAKDLFDMAVMQQDLVLDPQRISEGLKRTFSARHTHGLPEVVPAFPPEWAPALEKMSRDEGRQISLPEAERRVAQFLNPILAGLLDA